MTLGQVLKSKRLELEKSIEQISTATRIHLKVLKAIEEDHYGDLPARAFTRGFIISYCKALHLDPNQILKDYHDFLESKFAERPEKDHGHHGYAFEGKENEQNKRWMIISASVAAFFAILTLLFFKPQNKRHKEKHKELISEEAEIAATAIPTPMVEITASITPVPTPTPALTPAPTSAAAVVAVESKPKATPTPAPSIAAAKAPEVVKSAESSPSPSPTPIEDPLSKGDGMLPKDIGIKVTFTALEDTLIRYQSDQRKPFSIRLRKDKQLAIKASDLIRVEVSKPEQLKYKVSFKNKPASPMSELKEQNLELKKDGTSTSFAPGSF